MTIKVLTVFGTRPEAIKMAPLVKELACRSEIEQKVCVTAQHREMLDQVLDVFDISPDYDLNIMKKGQSLSQITSTILDSFDQVLDDFKPDLVLVHGDTTTTFTGALNAFYRRIPIGHVEAGLRTYKKYSPFPEEINRQFVSLVADLNFAPTEKSKENLLKAGVSEESIWVTGNTAIDALKTTVKEEYHNDIFTWLGNNRLLLLTAHRRENWGEPMRNIFRAIKRVCEKHQDVKVIYPVHLNPIVRELAKEELGDMDRIKLIEPLGVIDFHNFLNRASVILTDSGGIQEEAPSLGKPVIVVRDTTERPEGVEAGTLKLAGTDEDRVFEELDILLSYKKVYEKMSQRANPYGDGYASKYIADAILEYFNI